MPSCKGGNSIVTSSGEGEKMQFDHARNLTIEDHGDYTTATIRNPWDTTKTLHTYILVPDSAEVPANVPAGTVVRVPLKRALVYSTVHQSLVGEMGARDAIGGVCDAQYIHNPDLLGRIADGRVIDCGSSYTPNMERIMQLNPDAVILSPYENSGNYGKLGQMGIPLIECADYMESTPLGRTEWMKFYGLLFGCEDETARMFASIEKEYNALKSLTNSIVNRPKVVVDRLYGNTWYVPGHNSVMDAYIRDAGAVNPFGSIGNAGSVGLSGEQVLHEAGDADIWIVRYSQASDKTLRELAADNPIYGQFKALKDGRVYGCNTERINYYDQTPFHPHWLLRDLIKTFHPELSSLPGDTKYFTPLQQD